MTEWTTIGITPSGDAEATAVFASPDGIIYAPADAAARALDAMRATHFSGLPGKWLDVLGDSRSPGRIVIVGVGVGADQDEDRWRDAGGHLIEALRRLELDAIRLPASADFASDGSLAALLEGALLHSFQLDQQRHEPILATGAKWLVVDESAAPAVAEAQRRARSINRARAWVEQPANLLTPAVFAEEARLALSAVGVVVHVLGPAELEALGCGGLLAVAAGSDHEPRLVVAEWRGDPARHTWDAALVGKGLTFDGGGMNLKARPIIEKMKFDMGGAAAVLAALEMAAARGSRANVVAIAPMTENTISGKAYRSGDVIRSLAGLTIEVVNTDAEGRIVLADGITYAIREYDPAYIVDVATLTGLITGVLHEEYAALYASDDRLAEQLVRAGTDTHEDLWRMPLTKRQDYIVESAVADVINYGPSGFVGFGPGSPAAGAKFLERFTEGRPWAHIDIAGTAWATRRTSRTGPGATGFGASLLDRWLDIVDGEGRVQDRP